MPNPHHEFPATRKLIADVLTYLRYGTEGDVDREDIEMDVKNVLFEIDCYPRDPMEMRMEALAKLTDVERKLLGL